MSFDQRPPAPSLRRRVALATKGARLAMANGVARMLGLKLQAYEPQPGPPDPAARSGPAKTAPAVPAGKPPRFIPLQLQTPRECSICGDPLTETRRGSCLKCNAPARLRSLPPMLEQRIAPAMAGGPLDRPLLGFAMTGVEIQLVQQVFPHLKSVSLFGKYGQNHELGVDARDLTRYADGAFGAHFSILLFDYFTEHAQAIREAYRVLAPGGVFFTQFSPDRLTDGWDAPNQVKEVRARPGYFEYLPEGVALADIRVGRQWFAQALEDAGFKAEWVVGHDLATGENLDWLVGYKPRAKPL